MKRILILTTTLSTGGITSFTIPLVKELAKTHDVTLAYTVDTCDKLKQIPDNVRKVSYRAGSTKNTILYMLVHGWLHHALKIKTRNHGSVSPIASIQRVAFATVYKGNIIKNLIMDCQSYTKYRPNETTGGIFVSWRRKEELPTGA